MPVAKSCESMPNEIQSAVLVLVSHARFKFRVTGNAWLVPLRAVKVCVRRLSSIARLLFHENTCLEHERWTQAV